MRTILALIGCIILASCDKDRGEVAPLDLNGSGSISGVAKLFSANGFGLSSDGLRVSVANLEGTYSALTNTDGFYTIENVPYGIHDLTYEKEGFGTYKRGDIVHTEEATFIEERDFLSQKSTTTITTIQIETSDTGLQVSYSTNPPASDATPRFARIFFHTSADVSDTIHTDFTNVIYTNSTPFNAVFTYDQIRQLGIPPGATVYALVYGESYFSNYYKDPEFGIDTFPNLNPNTVAPISFVLP